MTTNVRDALATVAPGQKCMSLPAGRSAGAAEPTGA